MFIAAFTANLCSSLASPTNGAISNMLVTFGDTVAYGCSYGYWLAGESIRGCDVNCSGNRCQLSGIKPACNGGLLLVSTYPQLF